MAPRKSSPPPEFKRSEVTQPTLYGESATVRREQQGILEIETPLPGPIEDLENSEPPLPWGATEEEPEQLSQERGRLLCVKVLRDEGVWTIQNGLRPDQLSSLHAIFQRLPHLEHEFAGDLSKPTTDFLSGRSETPPVSASNISVHNPEGMSQDIEEISLTCLWIEAENMRLSLSWIASKALLNMSFSDLYSFGYWVRTLEDKVAWEIHAIRGEMLSIAESKGGTLKSRNEDDRLRARRMAMESLVGSGRSASAAARIVARSYGGISESIRSDFYRWKAKVRRKL